MIEAVLPSETPEVVEPIRRNIVILAVRMFATLFVADTVYAALLMLLVVGYVPQEWHALYAFFLWILHTLKNLSLIYLLLVLVIRWTSTLYYVTSGHLIRQRGVFTIKETVFQLRDIESVTMSQSWLGRVLDFGDITITFLFAQNKEEVRLYAINHPQRYEQLFAKFV